MNWLLKMITGNPLVLLWMALAVFGFGVASGGGAAWFVQGLRLTHAEQEFTQYKQTQVKLIQEAKDAADLQRDKASAAYASASRQLADSIEAGDVYRRCVAAGKCGRVQRNVPACTGIRLPTIGAVDGTGGNAIPVAGEPAAEEESCKGLAKDAAMVQLRLNQLQGEIEAQPGYSR